MASYRFVTEWRLHAPIERVFATVEDAEAWPAWWTMVKKVCPVRGPDDANGLAGIRTRLGGVDGTYHRLD